MSKSFEIDKRTIRYNSSDKFDFPVFACSRWCRPLDQRVECVQAFNVLVIRQGKIKQNIQVPSGCNCLLT